MEYMSSRDKEITVESHDQVWRRFDSPAHAYVTIKKPAVDTERHRYPQSCISKDLLDMLFAFGYLRCFSNIPADKPNNNNNNSEILQEIDELIAKKTKLIFITT